MESNDGEGGNFVLANEHVPPVDAGSKERGKQTFGEGAGRFEGVSYKQKVPFQSTSLNVN